MIRAHLGIKGRRNEPIFGFDQHGHPLTVSIQPGFPPIRVGIAVQRIERPIQVILADEHRKPISYHFFPNEIKRPVLPDFFNNIVDNISDNAKFVVFWADGDILPANAWRELLEAFTAWANRNGLMPMASSVASGDARVEFKLDWNTEDRNRGLVKICFMYALSKLSENNRFSHAFKATRKYILRGLHYPQNYWKHSPILQWNGSYPGIDVLKDHKFTYFLALVIKDNSLYCLIRLHNMGLFAVRLSTATEDPLGTNSLTTYLLCKEDNEKYSLIENEFSTEEANAFAKSVINSGQL